VLEARIFNPEEKKRVTDELRGGTWGADEAGNKDELYPAAIIVLIDLKCVRLPS